MQARSPHLRAVAEELSSLRVLRLEAQRIREPSEPGAPAGLSADGANLAATLAAQSPGALAEIRADVASLVPGVRTFEVVVEGDTLVVQMENVRWPAPPLACPLRRDAAHPGALDSAPRETPRAR